MQVQTRGRNRGDVFSLFDSCGSCLGTLAIMGVFLLIGGGLSVWGWTILQNARASATWPTAEGVITASEVTESRDGEGHDSYSPEVAYQYTAGNQEHESYTIKFGENSYDNRGRAEAIAATYPVGQPVTVYYDPEEPGRSVLEPGVSGGSYIVLGVGLLFVVLSLILGPLAWFFGDHSS